MTFDGFVTAAIRAELADDCAGAFVDQVHQPLATRAVIAFTGRGARQLWLFSVDAEGARCHAVQNRPSARGSPPPFCMLLRKHLRGARLEAVEQPGFDRVLRLRFHRGDGAPTLVHEVMGRHSNLLLLDETETILGAIKLVPPSRSRARPILPGLRYEPAPTTRRDPREATLQEIGRLAASQSSGAEWLVSQFNGISPFAAREVAARGEPCDPASLAVALSALVERAEAGAFEPVLVRDEGGRPAGFWAFGSAQVSPDRQEGVGSMSTAVEAFYQFREEASAREQLRGSLRAALQHALTAQRRQGEEAARHLAALDSVEQLRISGELLTAARGIARGTASVSLPNYYDPDQRPLEIALEPELSARENAERYFRRYRRAIAAAERAIERLPAVEERIRQLEEFSTRAEAADTLELEGIRRQLLDAAVLREGRPASAERPEPAERMPPGVRIRRRRVEDWEILWGENAVSNDYLTTRIARPGDLWLHARAVTGAHIVVRGERKGSDVPRDVLAAAARIAAAHSDARHSSVVPVDYTFRRYVRKPRGSPPGSVTYQSERTLHVSGLDMGESSRVE
jgi:predicted ribosome quality control (RQC) complex YloA/Tae2 family protein